MSHETKSHSVGRMIQGIITMVARGYYLGTPTVFSTKGSQIQQTHTTKALSHILVKTYHFVSGGSVSHEAKSHSVGRMIQGIITMVAKGYYLGTSDCFNGKSYIQQIGYA